MTGVDANDYAQIPEELRRKLPLPDNNFQSDDNFVTPEFNDPKITRDLVLSNLTTEDIEYIEHVGNVLSILDMIESKSDVPLTEYKKFFFDLYKRRIVSSRAKGGEASKLLRSQFTHVNENHTQKVEMPDQKKDKKGIIGGWL